MDVMIPLMAASQRQGSRCQNTEIRYALRSIDKHCSWVKNVIIVGDAPGFCKNIIHVPFIDGDFKDFNIAAKVAKAFEVSDKFMFTNDDIFILEDIGKDIPNYYQGELPTQPFPLKGPTHHTKLYNTRIALEAINKPTLHFDCHVPIVYEKERYMAMFNAFYDLMNQNVGLTVKSSYANYHNLQGTFIDDCKLRKYHNVQAVIEKTAGRTFFSVDDKMMIPIGKLNLPFIEYLNTLYPRKSRWEI